VAGHFAVGAAGADAAADGGGCVALPRVRVRVLPSPGTMLLMTGVASRQCSNLGMV
jgi:hypothetical protein